MEDLTRPPGATGGGGWPVFLARLSLSISPRLSILGLFLAHSLQPPVFPYPVTRCVSLSICCVSTSLCPPPINPVGPVKMTPRKTRGVEGAEGDDRMTTLIWPRGVEGRAGEGRVGKNKRIREEGNRKRGKGAKIPKSQRDFL